MRTSSKNWLPSTMSILKWDPPTCVRSRPNKKSRSKRRLAKSATIFLRAAMIAAEEEHWIEDQLLDATDVDLRAGASSAKGALSVAELRDLPIALQRREILKWLRTRKIMNVGFDVVEDVRLLLGHESRVAKVNRPRDRHARRRAGKIYIE